jgi:hypothetical protein
VTAAHYERVQQLQRLFFKHVPKLRELALANCGTGETTCGWGCVVGLLLFSAVLAAAGKTGSDGARHCLLGSHVGWDAACSSSAARGTALRVPALPSSLAHFCVTQVAAAPLPLCRCCCSGEARGVE